MFDTKKYYSLLKSVFTSKPLYCFEILDSTNSYILKNDIPDYSVVLAEIQTAGKGRNRHVWWSPSDDNLYFSICLKTFPAQKLMPLNVVLGYAVCDTLREYISCSLKWPNDIFVNYKKVGGILIETLFSGNHLQKAVAGVGINLNTQIIDTSLKDKATSVFIETGCKTEREKFLASLLDNLDEKLRLLINDNFDIRDYWKDYSCFLDKQISVTVENKKEFFIEKGINEYGGLIVEDKCGSRKEIYSGEVGYDFCG